MPTDDERREVARRLRELRVTAPGVTSVGHGYLWSLLWAVSREELGESNRCDWFERMCSRLADLIEPNRGSGGRTILCAHCENASWCGCEPGDEEGGCDFEPSVTEGNHHDVAMFHQHFIEWLDDVMEDMTHTFNLDSKEE